MLSPAREIAAIAMNCAAWPLDVATAATPPSMAAMRLSKTCYRARELGCIVYKMKAHVPLLGCPYERRCFPLSWIE